MRIFFKILILTLLSLSLKAQSPSGLPAPYSTGYYRIGWIQSDSGTIAALRDTTVRSKYIGLNFLWLHSGMDSSFWFWNGLRYIKSLNTQDTLPGRFLVTQSFLGNQGYLKNITGLIQQGTNVTVTGSGTAISPYVINASGGGGSPLATASGDASGTVSGTNLPLTLATVNSNVGTFGDAAHSADFTVDAKGRITGAGQTAIQITESQVTNLTSDLAGKQASITIGSTSQYFRGDLSLATFPTNLSSFTNGPGYITANQPISFTASGDVTGTYTNPTTLTPTLTLKNTGIGAGSCTSCNVTIDAQGRVTNYTNGSGGGGGISQLFGKAPVIILGTDTVTVDTLSGNQNLATQGFVLRQGYLTGNQTITLTGAVTGIGTTAITTSLASTISPGSCTSCNLTFNAEGQLTAASNGSGGGGISQLFGKSPIIILGTDTVTADTTSGNQKLATQGFVSRGYQPIGSYITALTAGDGTAIGPGSSVFTLSTVNSNTGSFGTASNVGTYTVNGKGLITAASNTPIQITESQVTNLTTDLGNKLSTTLPSGDIFVGNGSNVATGVPMTGDVGISNAGLTTIQPNVVTYAKIQAAVGQGLIGAQSAGNFQLVTLGTNLSMTGGVLNATGGAGSQTFQQTLTTGNTLTKSDSVNQAGNNFYWYGGGQHRVDSLLLSRQIAFGAPTAMTDIGNSMTVGQNASNQATTAYTPLLAAYYGGLTRVNLALSGSGAWHQIDTFNINTNAPDVNLVTWMAGFNDLRRSGTNYLTVRKICNTLQACFINHFAKNQLSAGATNANLTRYGTWTTTFPAQSVGGKSSNNGAYTTTNGDSLTFKFTDSTVYWTSIGTDSSYGASNYSESVQVYIDGALIQTVSLDNQTDGISDGIYDNKRSPISFVYHGLNPAVQHTLKLVNNTAHSYFLVVDQLGTLQEASTSKPFVVFEIPHMDATGYAISPNLSRAGLTDSTNLSIDSCVKKFIPNFPIFVTKTNNFYTATFGVDLSSDHIHPNDLGHSEIAQSAEAVLPNVINGLFTTPGTIYYSNSGFYGNYKGTIVNFGATQNAILANPTTPQSANFSISGFGRVGGTMFSGSNAGTTSTLPAIWAYTGGSSTIKMYKSGTDNYLLSMDSSNATGVNLHIGAGTVGLGKISGGSYSDGFVLDPTAGSYMTVVGGGASFNGNIIPSTTAVRSLGSASEVWASLYLNKPVGAIPFISTSGLVADDTSRIFYNATNKYLGLGTSAPATALHIKLPAPVFELQDINGTNAVFYGAFTDNAQFSIDRNPGNSVFNDPTKSSSQISLISNAGPSSIDFLTTTTVNTTPGITMILSGNGNLLLGKLADNGLARLQDTAGAYFGDSVILNKVITGTSTDSVLVINAVTHAIHKVAQSSIGGGGGVATVGAFSGSSQTNGATISGTTITFGPADATNPGMIKATGSQTLGATLTMPAPLFSGLASAGINDSVLTVDPSTGQVRRRSGTFNLYGGQAIKFTGIDTVNWGGTLTGPDTVYQANNPITISGGQFTLGNLLATRTWNPNNAIPGSIFSIQPGTLNDATTSASGTISNVYVSGITGVLLTATNTAVTYTNAFNLYINQGPTASTNVTVSHSYGLGVSGYTWLQSNTGIGITPNSSTVLALSPATTSSSSLNINSSATVNVTSPVSGDVWWNGTNLYFYDGSVKRDLLAGIRNYQHTIFTPTAASTTNLINNQYNIINPATGGLSFTLNLPSSPNNNDCVYVKFDQTATVVTYANGTVVGGISAPVAGQVVVFVYDSGSSTWY